MANTTNLNLVKPAGTDHALVSVINSNMDIIDSKVGAVPSNASVQGQIDTLNNQITEITTKKSYNFIGSSNVSVSRIGNICYLSCIIGTYTNSSAGGRLTVTAGTSSEGLTLPSGYRPIAACEIKEANLGKRISVYTDGNIVCTEQITGQSLRFSGCWMTTDAMPT